jgi:large subunit ribosomal protein L25
VLDVTIDGGKQHSAILKEFQRDAVRGLITHVDLQEVRLDQPIHSAVAVTLVGEPAGVKEGGVLSQVTAEVNVEGLPLEIPQHLELDVSGMHINDTVRVGELSLPDGITLLDDPEEVLATVTQPTREEVPEETLDEGEQQATAGLTEGELPESASEAPADPDAAAAGGEGTVEG